MPLAHLLTVERIAAAAQADDTDAVLDLAALLLAGDAPAHTTNIGDSLRRRERLGSTAIGHGIAIPHGRSDAFDEPRGAFLRLDRPIEFGASDQQAVDLVFALIVPAHFTQQHLQLLAELAERFADADYRTALREADGKSELHDLLTEPLAPAAANRSGTGQP